MNANPTYKPFFKVNKSHQGVTLPGQHDPLYLPKSLKEFPQVIFISFRWKISNKGYFNLANFFLINFWFLLSPLNSWMQITKKEF
nr:hypothetical protein Iba_chr05cCG5920 [Ipomoea batatas]